MKRSLTLIKYTLCFLLFLEMFFWIGSWITQGAQKIANTQQSAAGGTYKIICVGESNTLVGGKDSYPSQLQNILNERLPGRQIEVINQGMAGYSTARIAQELPEWIRAMKPSMVIAMVGIYDGEQIRRDKIQDASPLRGFLQNVKLVQLAEKLEQKMAASLQAYLLRQRQQFVPGSRDSAAGMTEHEMFQLAMKNAPEDLRKVYMLIVLTENNPNPAIAEQFFAKFFGLNPPPAIYKWVIKQYGRFLMRNKLYERFVNVLDDIPTNAWSMEWVNGYCTSDDHVAHVRSAIERKVKKTDDTDAYGYVSACLEKNGQKSLAEAYMKDKMGTFRDSYTSAGTRKEYMIIKDLLISHQIQPVFVQYPLRNIKTLTAMFESQPEKNKIIFVDNGPVFKDAIAASSYSTYFVDRASGDTGHNTPLGKRLLATNIADAIIPRINGTH